MKQKYGRFHLALPWLISQSSFASSAQTWNDAVCPDEMIVAETVKGTIVQEASSCTPKYINTEKGMVVMS